MLLELLKNRILQYATLVYLSFVGASILISVSTLQLQLIPYVVTAYTILYICSIGLVIVSVLENKQKKHIKLS